MKKARTEVVLLWAETTPERIGFLIKIEVIDEAFKDSIMAIRRESQVDACIGVSRSVKVDTDLIKDIEVYYGTHGGATMFGDLAKAVEKVLIDAIV